LPFVHTHFENREGGVIWGFSRGSEEGAPFDKLKQRKKLQLGKEPGQVQGQLKFFSPTSEKKRSEKSQQDEVGGGPRPGPLSRKKKFVGFRKDREVQWETRR